MYKIKKTMKKEISLLLNSFYT